MDHQIKQDYLTQVVIPNFKCLINEQIYSSIFNDKYELVICTARSANSIGYSRWEEAVGISYASNNLELAKRIFGENYDHSTIEKYLNDILCAQKRVFTDHIVTSYFDLLPYSGTFKSFLVTYIPVFHPSGEVVAIQSFAIESKFFGFQEHFYRLAMTPLEKDYKHKKSLTKREHEILFLLSNGLNHKQIANTLELSRSTVSNIIATQLSPKFDIAGSSTTLLCQIAIEHGYWHDIPRSLYRPFVVNLEQSTSDLL